MIFNIYIYIITITCLTFFPYYAHTTLKIDHTPTTIIRDNFSKLDRPEGVTFSPSGKYIATANSLINTITFYKRLGDHGSAYETTPAFSIEGAESQLNYPHDIAFSPDSRYLAVANRIGNSITIYEKHQINDTYKTAPIAILQGPFSGINYPDAVRYCPTNNILAVANLGNHSISFYHYTDNIYEQTPYQIIQDSPNILSVPDGLDFSIDGELLAVTSHDTHSVLIYQQIADSNGMYTSRPVEIIQGPQTNLCYPHSVTFDPTKNYLCVSSSQGEKNINIFQKTSNNFPRYNSKPPLTLEIIEMYDKSTINLLKQLHQEGGCKGVSFSLDGSSLAITQNLSNDLLKLPYSVGVLLVYPVKISNK